MTAMLVGHMIMRTTYTHTDSYYIYINTQYLLLIQRYRHRETIFTFRTILSSWLKRN